MAIFSTNHSARVGELPWASRPERQRTIEHLENLSLLLDAAYGIPGTKLRFGLDALLGLVPIAGDVASAALSAYLIYQARRLGLPKTAIARMIGNVALDAVLGAVPLFGDIFDVFWRANVRNVAILRRHVGGAAKR
jgi:Domain of unknown function (DUF4112)